MKTIIETEKIFISIFEEAATEPTYGIKESAKLKYGKQFFEDNKRWQENENLTPIELLKQIIHNNKVNNYSGYETI
jgi:hypothetical protein